MSANIAFSLSAAVVSLVIVALAAVKGDWAVVVVYALLVLGFLARAAFGRRQRAAGRSVGPPPGPDHDREPRLKGARFRRR